LEPKKIYLGMVRLVFGFIHVRRLARTDNMPYVLRASVRQTEARPARSPTEFEASVDFRIGWCC
jgi:hypothetical protein